MNLPHDDIDPDGLLEYSVVFTDRSLNHMSVRFIAVMQELLAMLRQTYQADSVAIVPGGGTYAMESVARQVATGKRCLIIRNGLFSFRWSQILEQGQISDDIIVHKARPTSPQHQAPWEPAPLDEVVASIREHRPAVIFAPHVETASGMILPDAYLKAVADAAHEVGALFVLDCIASGAMWVAMRDIGVDVLISAPQKGWSGSPGAGYVMLNETARTAVEATTSTSFAMDLGRWLAIADGYVEGRAAYHATMPTDTLQRNLAQMQETHSRGLDTVRAAQVELGAQVRALVADRGLPPLTVGEYAAPGVVVVYTDDPELRTGAQLKTVGLQVAAGVPLQCDEPEDFSTFRIGLFGLDKLADIDGAVARFAAALDAVPIDSNL